MSGKVCLVTGASSGIGRAFAVRLDSLGYKVSLVGRRREKLEEVAGALSSAGITLQKVINMEVQLSCVVHRCSDSRM